MVEPELTPLELVRKGQRLERVRIIKCPSFLVDNLSLSHHILCFHLNMALQALRAWGPILPNIPEYSRKNKKRLAELVRLGVPGPVRGNAKYRSCVCSFGGICCVDSCAHVRAVVGDEGITEFVFLFITYISSFYSLPLEGIVWQRLAEMCRKERRRSMDRDLEYAELLEEYVQCQLAMSRAVVVTRASSARVTAGRSMTNDGKSQTGLSM